MNKCFSKVTEVVSAVSKKYGETYAIDDSRLQDVKSACEIIDGLYKEFDGESIGVRVDEPAMELVVCLQCAEMIMKNGRSHPFFSLVNLADTVRFSKAGDDLLQIDFGFCNLWRS